MISSKDQMFFTWNDLKRLFLRHRVKIQSAALLSGLGMFLFLLTSPLQYRVEATYKQSAKHKELSLNMKEMFQQFIEMPTESGTAAVMQSNEVFKRGVEDLGLQVFCAPRWLPWELFKRIADHVCTLCGRDLEDQDSFTFRNVSYTGEKPFLLTLKVMEGGAYQLYDKNKQFLCEARIGESVEIPSVSLTLIHIPKGAKKNSYYSLVVHPLIPTIEKLRAQLKIYPHRLDKHILQLTFFSRDRVLGTTFLNHLIQSYHHFLKEENDAICRQQLEYLQKRRDELTSYYDASLQEHSAYLSENLMRYGFIGFEQEIKTLSDPKYLYTAKLFDIELELKRLGTPQKISFCTSPSQEEIFLVEKQIREASLLLESLEQHKPFPPTPSLSKDPEMAIALLVKQISSCVGLDQQQRGGQHSSISALREMIHQLEQKRIILEEDFKGQQEGFDEFAGLTLATAQGLLAEYTRQRDTLGAQLKELIFLREQLGRSDFEMSSLGGVFEDPVIREMVSRSSAISLQIKDEDNRSAREHVRLVETLQTQKNFLSQYLFQTIDVKRLKGKLLGNKIISLQQAARKLLHSEKELLKAKLEELSKKMGTLPEKWQRESLLQLKKELGAVMLEGVSQLVEAKSLNRHTFYVSSGPLDKAIVPLKPHPQKFVFFSLTATFLGGIFCFLFFFCKTLFKGLPVSDETLHLLGFPVSGKLSKFCNMSLSQLKAEDLETLRRALSSLEGKVILCALGKHPNFSPSLAQLLHLKGSRVLLIDCAFNKTVHEGQMPGLWHYLQKEILSPPILNHEGYDILHSGGTSRYGLELLLSSRFQELLETLKQRYDVILLHSRTSPVEAEGFSLLKIADAAIITVQQECREDLEVYGTWAVEKQQKKITFVYAEE